MEQQSKVPEAEPDSSAANRIAELRALIDHLETAREEEKRTVARELHDELGSALTSLTMYLSRIYKALPDQPEWQDTTKKVQAIVGSLVATTRRIQIKLQPIMLDLFGLKAGLTEHVNEFAQHAAIDCNISLPDEEVQLSPKLEITVYRMLQEALDNVAKHAEARRVDVILDIDDDHVTLTVRDDGIGISDDRLHHQSTFGLRGLRERASFLGGSATIVANKDAGTTLQITLPTAL